MCGLDHIPDSTYHATTVDRLESIMKNGLVPGSPRSSKFGESKGVYVINDYVMLYEDGMESFTGHKVILKVDVSSFKDKLQPDPEWRSSDFHIKEHLPDDLAWFVDFVIEPKFITVLYIHED